MKIDLRIASFSLIAALFLYAGAADVLAQATGLKGKIRANNGQGISGAVVTVSKDGREAGSTRTASDGGFLLTGIDPGFYSLRVEADGYASGSLVGVEVKKNRVRNLGDRLFLAVDQGTLVILRGSVFFREGTSVTGARVDLERLNDDGSVKKIDSANSTVSGEFTFRQPDGKATYRVTARYKGVSGSKEITVENAAVYRIAIILDLSHQDR